MRKHIYFANLYLIIQRLCNFCNEYKLLYNLFILKLNLKLNIYFDIDIKIEKLKKLKFLYRSR